MVGTRKPIKNLGWQQNWQVTCTEVMNAAAICSLIRYRIWEKERSQRLFGRSTLEKLRGFHFSKWGWMQLLTSLISVPWPHPLICCNPSRDTIFHFTSSLHFPSIWSSKKPKPSGVHLVTQHMDNAISFILHQHDSFLTSYKQNKRTCACVCLFLW